MAPIELFPVPSYIPAGVLTAHIFFVGHFSLVAGRTILRSYNALPPSSATRHREPLRRGYVQTFSLLALLSLATAAFFGATFGSLSYRVWAAERGIELPDSIFGDKGALRGGEHPGRLHVVRWLSDTSFYRDAFEIATEKTRHFWWAQQIDLGLVSWSMYLAIEGQRRKISNLWAFFALAQLTSLSYAQNLFFITVLLTPVPLSENIHEFTKTSGPVSPSRYSQLIAKIVPTKPDGFVPHQALYISILLCVFTTIFLTPIASNTPSFMTIYLLSRILPFSFIALPYIIPESWGSIQTHPHDAHTTYTTLFRTISTVSALLHFKASCLALFYNTPESTYYRHSLLHPFKEEHLSAFNRGSTAFGRIFGAIREHPAVSAVGWDVLLSGLSLGVWAATRGLDAGDMFWSIIPFTKHAGGDIESRSLGIKEEADTAAMKVKSTPGVKRRLSRPRKSENTSGLGDTTTVSAPRRRLRAVKKNVQNYDDIHDATYEPENEQLEEGDEDVEDEWETGALAWGLITAGGLGVGSASVYGAEVRAR